MTVGTQRDDVFALFEDIAAARAVAVVMHVAVRGHIFFGEGEGKRFAAVRLDDARLIEGGEVDRSLFDGVFAVIIGIRRGIIQLHHAFAGDVARVGDAHFYSDVVAHIVEGDDLLLEARIAEAVAEGIHHGGVVIEGVVHLIRRFIIAVADVDALFVFHERSVDVHAVRIRTRVVIEGHLHIGIGRVRGEVRRPQVDRLAGEILFAAQQVGKGLAADAAGIADPDDGVYLVFAAHEDIQLHQRAGIDDRHHAVARLLGKADGLFFILGKLQFVLGAVGIGVQLQVAALARVSADEHEARGIFTARRRARVDARVVLGEEGVAARAGVDIGDGLAGRGAGRLAHLFRRSAAHLGDDLFVHFKIGSDGRFHRLRFGIGAGIVMHAVVHGARAEHRIDGVEIAVAERRHRAPLFERQDLLRRRSSAVFEEHEALVADPAGDLRRRFQRLFRGRILGFVEFQIPRFRAFDVRHMPLAPAEEVIQRHRIGVHHAGHRDDGRQQDRQDRHPDAQKRLVAHLLSCHKALLIILRKPCSALFGHSIAQKNFLTRGNA